MASFTPLNISNGYAQSYIHDTHDDTPVLTRLNKQSSKIEKQGLKLEDLAVRFDKLDTKLDKVAENMTELKIELNKTIHECEMRFERALSSWLFRTTVLVILLTLLSSCSIANYLLFRPLGLSSHHWPYTSSPHSRCF